ncbi:MAG TPA: carboxypeptidase regulatory-like domain-containing protein [Gemmatimonadales bacterium]
MRGKIQPGPAVRRVLALGGLAVGSLAWAAQPAEVTGRVTMLEKDDQRGDDVGQAVVWLTGPPASPRSPIETDLGTSDKEFSPHVLVVPVGSTVSFSNHDPFNHNVFSLSEENPFDLGLYGRGEARSVRFERPGVVRVYCNVHAQMSALVLVRDTPWYTQPASDGSFSLGAVPPGRYTLHAWHERAPEVARPLEVTAEGGEPLSIELDARGFQFKPHLNKHGQPYPQQGRRY